MKKQIFKAVSLLMLPIFFSSCGNGKLTKEEAKKQIDEYANTKQRAMFNIPFNYQSFNSDEIGKNNFNALEAAKKAGYINYALQNSPDIYLMSSIQLLEKAKPFLISTGQGSTDYQFSAGTRSSEIVSIAEPAPDAEGKIVCNVEYTVGLVPNEFFKTLSVIPKNSFAYYLPYLGYLEGVTIKGKFIKMQDGWKFEERE